MALAHITGGQYVPMVDAGRLAQMIIAGVREEVSLNRVMHSSRNDIVRVVQRATREGVDNLETATRLQRTLDQKKVRVNRMSNTAGIPSKQAEECYSKCVDMADMQSQYKMTPTSSTTKPAQLDYKLEEQTGVTLEQSKRIVQKARSWNYPADEPTRSDHSTPCRYGEKCHDFSPQHRSKFEHPSNLPPDTQLSTRLSTRTSCRYGSDCTDHSRSHQEKFSHPITSISASRRTSVPCRYGDNCHNHDEDHRAKYSHTSHSNNTSRRAECRYGEGCRDHGDDHRRRFSHPDD